MSVDILNDANDDLIQESLMDLKKEVEAMKPTESLPWEFKLIKRMKDKEKRNWKMYSYTLESWGNYRWIDSKYMEKTNDFVHLLPGRNFCDISWNIISKREFSKWETVYIKVPDTDVFDEVPKMTLEDIKNLSDTDIRMLYDSYQEFSGSDAEAHRGSMYEHADQGWKYVMFKGKKIYIQYFFLDHTRLINKEPCFLVSEGEGCVDYIAIWRYDWKIFDWVDCDYDKSIRRWNIELHDSWYKKYW